MSKRHPDRFRVPHNRDLTAASAEIEYFSTDERVYRRQAVARGWFLDGQSNPVQAGDQPRVGITIALAQDAGWASCGVVLQSATTDRKWSGRCPLWDRNRLVLRAFIKALAVLTTPHLVIVTCASEYLVSNLMEGYAHGWRRDEWTKFNGGQAKNPDLWEQVLAGCDPHLIRLLYPTTTKPLDPEAEHLAMERLHRPALPA